MNQKENVSEKKELYRFRLLPLYGEVTDESVKDVVLPLLKESKREVLLTLSSPGGSVDAGRAVIDAVRWAQVPVYTLAIGSCYSMAFQISLYGTLRFCTPYTTFMYHDTKYDFSYFSHPNEVNEVVQIQKEQDKQLTEDMFKLTKLDRKAVLDDFKNRRNKYLNAKEALQLGVVDYVVNNESEMVKVIESHYKKGDNSGNKKTKISKKKAS